MIGYNEYHTWFGSKTEATTDGRHAGDPISFGRGQSNERDCSGLTALLNSIAGCDLHNLVSESAVTNIMLDEQIVKDDAQFEKLVLILETYFHNDGMHYTSLISYPAMN